MSLLPRIRSPRTPAINLRYQLSPHSITSHHPRFMSTTGSKASGNGAAAGKKKPFKILMLHGYTQSGPLLDAKTKALTKFLTKTLSTPPHNLDVQYIYPTGPHLLLPSDIPGFDPSSQSSSDEKPETHAWWRKSDATGSYVGFSRGMHRVASSIRESVSQDSHPIDGVLGFSQGGCLAAIVASALDESNRGNPPVDNPFYPSSGEEENEERTWLPSLRSANLNQPLKFAVIYAGFWATDPTLQWLYNAPKIATPSVHFVGSLDTVVDEERTGQLLEKWVEDRREVVTHPGGHYVPVAKQWVVALAGFLIKRLKAIQEEEQEKEDGEKL